jgi:hypothetical protein
VRGPRSLSPSVRRGLDATVRAVVAGLAGAERPRRLALLVAAALFASPFAPWYGQTVTARGVDGPRRMTVALTGWQQLSASAVVCAIVAVGVAGWLIVRAGIVVEGLGAPGRRSARARTDGVLTAAAGGLCAVLLVITLVAPPHPALAGTGPVAHSTATGRWGAGLALALALGLVLLGAAIAREAARAGDGVPDADGSGARGRPRPIRRPAGDPPLLDFDFAVGERPPGARRRRVDGGAARAARRRS